MPVRRATSDDAAELVRLRRVMFDAMEIGHAPLEAGRRGRSLKVQRDALERGDLQRTGSGGDARGQGYGRAVFAALLDRFAAEGVASVDLRATPYGEPLYRSFGFTEPRRVTLARWVPH